MAAALRTRGTTPISVVHKSAKDARRQAHKEEDVRREPTGILARRSRLHLAELLIVCRRLHKARHGITVGTVIAGGTLFFATAALLLLGYGEWINQYVLLLCHLLTAGLSVLFGLLKLPAKDYISLAAYDQEQKTQENT